ncbi:MAG: FHA domain-containing protein, partial [Lachnospiraceae bacterium]|nr:FHA domain-containing protein [Lachnospiraceae bacterium]
YESLDKEGTRRQLETLLAECEEQTASKEYKDKSKESLQSAVEEAKSLLNQDMVKDEDILNAISTLETARQQLQLKMKTTRKVIYVLAAVLVLLAAWVIKLLVDRHTWKKEQSSVTKEEPQTADKAKTKERIFEEIEEPDGDGTVILPHSKGRRKRPTATVKCERTGQIAIVDKDEFFIGQRADATDLTIEDNGAISRCHAKIFWNRESYMLTDLDSANGTFINGKEVAPKEEKRLKNGDKIVLADETFTFRIE